MKIMRNSLAGLVGIVALTLVVALTTLPEGRVIDMLKNLILIDGHPNASDAVGHAALYGLLTGVTYWVLRHRLRFSAAFWVAVGVGLLLGALTEISQHFTPGRTMALSDLLGNWLGVMTVAAVIGYGRSALGGRD